MTTILLMEVVVNEAIKTTIDFVGSQARLGKACGVSQAAVGKWLNGKAKPSPEKVPLIVKATKGLVKNYELRPDLPNLFRKPRSAA